MIIFLLLLSQSLIIALPVGVIEQIGLQFMTPRCLHISFMMPGVIVHLEMLLIKFHFISREISAIVLNNCVKIISNTPPPSKLRILFSYNLDDAMIRFLHYLPFVKVIHR